MKSWIVVPFVLASFISAALLFAAEPMLGKMALPPLGGTPAVWNTCLLFFQAILLVGYLGALALARLDGIVPWMGLGVLVSLLLAGYEAQPMVLRLDQAGFIKSLNSPTVTLLAGLLRASALPLGLISTTAPLTQHWFSRTQHARAHDPYFLYAASNAGSLLALLAYPLFFEPQLSLSAQGVIWKYAYSVLAILLGLSGVIALFQGSKIGREHLGNTGIIPEEIEGELALGQSTPKRSDWLYWVVLAAIPSSWLLGVTTFLTTNIASMPLLWVIPLAIFLLASILTFSEKLRPLASKPSRVFPWMALAVVLVQLAGFVHAFWLPLHLFTFFLGCLVCDLRLAASRPAARFATSFYLAIAIGGVLGGAFNALMAPLLFRGIAEYPLAIFCACLAFPKASGSSGIETRSLSDLVKQIVVPLSLLVMLFPLVLGLFNLNDSLVGAGLLIVASGLVAYASIKAGERPLQFGLTIGAILLAGLGATDPAGTTLLRERDFYGVVRVTFDPEANCRRLIHGLTLHGEQSLDLTLSSEPRTYFARSGPIGDIFRIMPKKVPGEVAIVGLGVGTLAAYAQPGERWTFYELDPAIVRIANDGNYFTYLRDSLAGSVTCVSGDARLQIRHADDHHYELIVLDAFGSDAVPVHLLSREAIQLYLSKLAPGGLLVFNITNGFVDLEPVIGLQARDADLVCRIRRDVRVLPEERKLGKQGSIWAVVGRTDSDLRGLATDSRWRIPNIRPGARPWTDDYSNLVSYLFILGRRQSDVLEPRSSSQ